MSFELADARLDAILDEALELDATARERLLAERCGADDELLAAAQRALDEIARDDLLAPSGALRGKLFEDLCASLEPAEPASGESSGSVLGPYRLLDRLGAGGMGEVWAAEQLEPVRRRVAVKIIKRGLDTAQIVARFEAERQVLALMEHPSIAKVLDAGSTPSGRPYIVMELVRGSSITEYCDARRLPVTDRLRLFRQVCGAVQHAHQKGIVHRDIKPSNVLVSEQQGQAMPKIIDFGVAKAIATATTDATSLTELGQVIGTREYMSPEQAEGRLLEVDTRSDIYSLGALLYSLLTGTTPFGSEELAGVGHELVQAVLRERDPPTPSQRLRRLPAEPGEAGAPSAREMAESRDTDPRTLVRQLEGDLDWITATALEKDRDRRYQSADALARDIERHLQHEPVQAGPPSAAYRARKFLRRNRGAVISAGAIALSLVTGIVMAAIFALGQARALAEAETAQQEAEAVLDFLNDDLLAAVAPGAHGRDASLRDAVDAAAEKIGDRFKDRPQVEASILMTLGNTYRELGLHEKAQPPLERARKLLEEKAPTDRERRVEVLHHLASLYRDQSLYDQAVGTLEHGVEVAVEAYGVESPELATMLTTLGDVYSRRGDYEAAESNLEAALEIQRAVFGEENEHTSRTMGNLAVLYRRLGRYEEAESLQLRVIDIGETMHGRDHPTVTIRLNNLAVLYTTQGRYRESERLLRRILAVDLENYGDEHPDVATDLFNLADVLTQQARYSEAIVTYRRSLAIDEKALGPDHRNVGTDLVQLAAALKEAGHEEEAERNLGRGLAILENTLGESHIEVGNALVHLGDLMRRQTRYDEAESLLLRAAAVLEKAENRVSSAHAARAMGLLHRDRGRRSMAEASLGQALAILREELPATHPYRIECEDEYRALLDVGVKAPARPE